MDNLSQQSDRSQVTARISSRRKSTAALRGLLAAGLLFGCAAPAVYARDNHDEHKDNAADTSTGRSADKSSDLEKTEKTERTEKNENASDTHSDAHRGPTTSSSTATTTASVTGGAHNLRDPFPPATPQRVVDVTAKLFPAVVRLDVAQEVYTEGKRSMQRGIGSGVIIDDEGRILTNFHVAGRAAEIFITLSNKERVRGTLVGDDHWTDLAVVQMDMEEVRKRKFEFRHAELGDSRTLIPGQDVMAIGTPFGLARTLTLGVVSNTERTFYPERMTIDEYETGMFANWIQMDTPINPGNSGGPLVDMNGKVVGINTRGGGQNLNFAVPINTAREVVKKILATAAKGKKGRVDRSDLGIELKPMQDLETFFDIDINKGVLVNSVDRNSPASKAGVKTQDILLELNDKPTNVRFPEELAAVRKLIADLPIGSEAKLTLRRGKDTVHVTAKSEKLQGAVGEEKEFKTWGVSVREVTRAYANQRMLDESTGVVITTESPGFPAQKAELFPGDVVHSVNGEEVKDLDSFTKLYDESVKNKEGEVLLEVQRGRNRHRAVLKVDY